MSTDRTAMPPERRLALVTAVASGGLAVALGAFGAHGLEARLEAAGHVATWETAVRYQMWHALAVLGYVALGGRGRVVPIAFLAGSALFAGSLYALALGGPSALGPVTPLGGVLVIVGWAAWGVELVRRSG